MRPLTPEEDAAIAEHERLNPQTIADVILPPVFVVADHEGALWPSVDGAKGEWEFFAFGPAWARALDLTARGWEAQVERFDYDTHAFVVVARPARLGVRLPPLADLPAQGCA